MIQLQYKEQWSRYEKQVLLWLCSKKLTLQFIIIYHNYAQSVQPHGYEQTQQKIIVLLIIQMQIERPLQKKTLKRH